MRITQTHHNPPLALQDLDLEDFVVRQLEQCSSFFLHTQKYIFSEVFLLRKITSFCDGNVAGFEREIVGDTKLY